MINKRVYIVKTPYFIHRNITTGEIVTWDSEDEALEFLSESGMYGDDAYVLPTTLEYVSGVLSHRR